MKVKRGNVGAFSILEAVVGMAVTAIIMGIIFVIFSVLSEQMLDFKNQNELIADLNRLTFTLNKDVFKNETIAVFEERIDFLGYSGDKTAYEIKEEYLLRTSETFVDTFHVKLQTIAIDSVKSNTGKIVFRKLKLHLEVNEKEIELNFYKRIYANELLEISTK